jgi:hypothetical protein
MATLKHLSSRHCNLVECTVAGIPGTASEPGRLPCARQKSMLQYTRRVPGPRAHAVHKVFRRITGSQLVERRKTYHKQAFSRQQDLSLCTGKVKDPYY